jgi:hypothetical protein
MHRPLSLALALVTAGLAVTATATEASAQQKETTPAAAAAKPDSGMWTTNPAERLLSRKTELSLTDAQVKKLEALKTKFAAKATPADTGKAAWNTHRSQMKEAMAVLTDAQKQKMESMHASRRTHRAQHDSLGHSHHGGTVAPADSAKH